MSTKHKATSPQDYAGLLERTAAALIDTAIVAPAAFGVSVFFAEILFANSNQLLLFGYIYLPIYLPLRGYYTARFESCGRQATPGAMFMGFKVTTEAGERMSLRLASARFLLGEGVSLILLAGLGCLLMLVTPKRQALQDLLLGTVCPRVACEKSAAS